jgi:hypothetical protein
MSHNEFHFERSETMHIAIDMVFTALGNNSEKIRADIERIVLSAANQGEFSSGAALAKMTLDKPDGKKERPPKFAVPIPLRSSESQQR